MDLQEFVRDALIQITEGVSNAQQKAHGAIINPTLKLMPFKKDSPEARHTLEPENLKGANLLATNYSEGHADLIEFDVAITVTSAERKGSEVGGKTKIEGKIIVASADVELQGKRTKETEHSTSHVSRIKFRVPVQFKTR